MASIAQEKSRKTSSRVVWGQTRQMERGIVFGPSMLGYDVNNGRLTVNPEGAEIVRLIFHKYVLEQVGTSEIARYLTIHGCRSYKGNTQWKSNAIIKILRNEKYAGDLIQKKSYTPDYLTHQKKTNRGQVPLVVIKDHHEPIVSREIWNLAQVRLRDHNKHKKGSGGHSNRYVCSGKIQCGECGQSFVARYKYLNNGTKIRRWSCGTVGCYVGKLLREDDAMQMLNTALGNLPWDMESSILKVAKLAVQSIELDSGDSYKVLESEIIRIENKKVIMMDSYFSGIIGKTDDGQDNNGCHIGNHLEELI